MGVFCQLYDSDGNTVGSEFQANTYTISVQRTPKVAALVGNWFVVTWDSDSQDGNDYGVFGQLFDSSGNKKGSEFQVNSYTTGFQGNRSVAAVSRSGFVVTWESYGQDGSNWGVFGQLFRNAKGMPWAPLLLLDD